MTDTWLSPAQRRFFERTRETSAHLHHAVRFDVAPNLTGAAVKAALARLVADQDVFAVRFTGSGVTRAPANAPQVQESRNEWPSSTSPPAEVMSGLHAAIDPGAGRLLEGALVVREAAAELILVAHHLVTDIVSWEVIRASLARHCARALAGREPEPLAPICGFWDWTAGLAELVNSGRLEVLRPMWQTMVQDAGGETVNAGVEADVARIDTRIAISSARARALRRSVPAIIVGALSYALDGESDFELEGHGRTVEGLQRDAIGSVGWFTARYPVRVRSRRPSILDCMAAADRALAMPAERTATYAALRYLPGPVTGALADGDLALHYAPVVSVNIRGTGARPSRIGPNRLIDGGKPCPGPAIAPDLRRAAPWEFDVVVDPAAIRMGVSYNRSLIPAARTAEVLRRAGAAIDECLGDSAEMGCGSERADVTPIRSAHDG